MPTKIQKPLAVREVERHLGLRCEARKDGCWETNWVVTSPTGVPLFHFVVDDEIVIGCSSPDMKTLQGITNEERMFRRSSEGVVTRSKGNPRNVPGDKIFVSPAGVPFEFIGRERDGFVELCHLEEGWTWFEPVDSFAERWVAG